MTAFVFGLIGAFLALNIYFLWGSIHTAIRAFGDSLAGPNRFGFGLILSGLGVLGSFMSLWSPPIDRLAAVFLVVAGIGLFWVNSGWTFIPLIFFLIAAFFGVQEHMPQKQ